MLAAGGAPVVHVWLTTVPVHFVEAKFVLFVCVHTFAMTVVGVPLQFCCGKDSALPPHWTESEHAQLAHASVKSAPTRCLLGAFAGHATSPSWSKHAAIPAGGVHASAVHAEAAGVQMRFGVVVTAAGVATPVAEHGPTAGIGGITLAFSPQTPF